MDAAPQGVARRPFFGKLFAGTGIASLSLLQTGCESQAFLQSSGWTAVASIALTIALGAGSYSYLKKHAKKNGAILRPEPQKPAEPPPNYFKPEAYARFTLTQAGNGKPSADLMKTISMDSFRLPEGINETSAGELQPALSRFSSYACRTSEKPPELMNERDMLMAKIEGFFASEAANISPFNGSKKAGRVIVSNMQPILGELAQFGEKAGKSGDHKLQAIVGELIAQANSIGGGFEPGEEQSPLSTFFVPEWRKPTLSGEE